MDYTKVEQLLERYWAGTITVEEQRELSQYFRFSDDVATRWPDEAAYFQYLSEAGAVEMPGDSFDQEVLDKIRAEQSTVRHIGQTRWWSRLAVAATVALLVAIVAGWWLGQSPDVENPTMAAEDSFEDPEKAFEEVKNKLMLISVALQDGKEQTQLLTKFNEAEETIKDEGASDPQTVK